VRDTGNVREHLNPKAGGEWRAIEEEFLRKGQVDVTQKALTLLRDQSVADAFQKVMGPVFPQHLAVLACGAYGLGQTFQPEVVPILVTATTDRNAEVRLAAVRGLDSLHTHAGPAIPALEKLLADPDEAVRERAKEVLDRLMRK